MTVIDLLLGCSAILLFVMPGVFIMFYIFPKKSLGEVFFVGGALGWGLLAVVGRHVPLDYWYIPLGALYAVGGGLIFRFIMAAPDEASARDKTGGLVWLAALAAFIPMFIPAAVGDLPPGKYSMYHLVLIRKILIGGVMPVDLTPISTISVQYPMGSHFMVALVSKVAGTLPHHAFRACFPAIFFLMGGLMYELGLKIFKGQKAPAFFGAFIWAALANWGGGRFFIEGDLPQLSALFMFLAFLWVLVAEKSFAGRVIAGILLAGVLCSHYGTMVMAIGVALTVLIAEISIEGKAGAWSITFGVATALAAVLGVDVFLRGMETVLIHGENEIFSYREVFLPLVQVLRAPGDFPFLMGALGLALIALRPEGKSKMLPLVWAAAAYFMLMVFGYLYRVVFFGYFGGFAALATPSDLVAVTAFPLSLAAGWYIAGREEGPPTYRFRIIAGTVVFTLYAVFRYYVEWQYLFGSAVPYLDQLVPILAVFVFMALIWLGAERGAKIPRMVGMLMLAGIMTAISVAGVIKSANLSKKNMMNKELADLYALEDMEAIPDDAFFVNKPVNAYDLSLYGWLPYWTWKECTYLVLPPTENRLGGDFYNRMRILPLDAYEVRVRAHLEGRSAAVLSPRDVDMSDMEYKSVYKSNHRSVHVYEPGKK